MYKFTDVISHADGHGASLLDAIAKPIATALAAAERLRDQPLPPSAIGAIEELSEAGAAAMNLLGLARDLQRAELGLLERTLEPRRLREAMDEVEDRWRDRADHHGAHLLTSYDGEPECVARVDWRGLHQIFDALIAHAMAKAAGGVVEASLRAHRDKHGVTIECRVRDNRVFADPEYLAKLLASAASAEEVGGLPILLALALAGRTVEVMGGALEADANPGRGVTLGFKAVCESADLDLGGHEASHGGRNAHVLVVDDNATNRMVVEALCEMFDCSTESVADGVEAVEAARVGRFDVILMDIKMPRMDGLMATREIRKLPGPAGQAPIIALTANADADEVRSYLAAGMHGVVEKPIKPDRLLEALDAALAKPTGRTDAAAA